MVEVFSCQVADEVAVQIPALKLAVFRVTDAIVVLILYSIA
jgi:hypothetical protein